MRNRFETVERAALASLHEAAPAAVRARLGMRLERIGGAVASIVPGIHSTVVNRVIGLGVERPASREDVGRIADRYAEAGVGRHLVHLDESARPDGLEGWIEAAGYGTYRAWVPFERSGTEPPEASTADLEVRRAAPGDAAEFGRIVADGFDLGEAGAPLVAGLTAHPAWRIYLTTDGDEIAGAAGLFVHDGAGWLDWAATRPKFRRRGSQSALLARRIADAVQAGCQALFTETGEAVPGDPQHSYHNIEAAGFEAGRPRANWVLER